MSIRLRYFEKSPENQRIRAEKAKRRRMTDPRAPQQGSSAMGDGHGRALQSQELGHPMAELPGSPPGAGDPYRLPDQPFLMIPFDVSRCLEDQTTSESYETRTVASVSKRASQRSKNYIHTTSVLREKPQKPKDTR